MPRSGDRNDKYTLCSPTTATPLNIVLPRVFPFVIVASTWIHEVARAALGATIYNRSVVKKAAGGSEDPGLYLQGLVCKDVSAF